MSLVRDRTKVPADLDLLFVAITEEDILKREGQCTECAPRGFALLGTQACTAAERKSLLVLHM